MNNIIKLQNKFKAWGVVGHSLRLYKTIFVLRLLSAGALYAPSEYSALEEAEEADEEGRLVKKCPEVLVLGLAVWMNLCCMPVLMGFAVGMLFCSMPVELVVGLAEGIFCCRPMNLELASLFLAASLFASAFLRSSQASLVLSAMNKNNIDKFTVRI